MNQFPREPGRSWSELLWSSSVNHFCCNCTATWVQGRGGYRLCVGQGGGHRCHILRCAHGSDILWGPSLENEISFKHKRVWTAFMPQRRNTWGPESRELVCPARPFTLSRKFIFKCTLYVQYLKVTRSTDSRDRHLGSEFHSHFFCLCGVGKLFKLYVLIHLSVQ